MTESFLMPVLIHEGPQTRIDQAIAAADQRISRREAKRLLDEARVVVNGVVTSVASKPVRGGDRIAILTDAPEPSILEQSDERIVVDKPSGLASQLPRRNGPLSLTEVLAGHFKRLGEPADLWVVHRLDTGTSGVIVYARARGEAARLSALFASHSVVKRYLALIRGTLERDLVLDDAIARTGSSMFAASAVGRAARTVVHPLETRSGFTLADIEIATGRTHQIRVHLSSAGFPILGDSRYGGPPAKRLMLHAWKLSHPDIGDLEAPVPAELGRPGLVVPV